MPLEWSALEISARLSPPWGGAMPHSLGNILHKLNCCSSHNDEFHLNVGCNFFNSLEIVDNFYDAKW